MLWSPIVRLSEHPVVSPNSISPTQRTLVRTAPSSSNSRNAWLRNFDSTSKARSFWLGRGRAISELDCEPLGRCPRSYRAKCPVLVAAGCDLHVCQARVHGFWYCSSVSIACRTKLARSMVVLLILPRAGERVKRVKVKLPEEGSPSLHLGRLGIPAELPAKGSDSPRCTEGRRAWSSRPIGCR